jgi:hypothetical protein
MSDQKNGKTSEEKAEFVEWLITQVGGLDAAESRFRRYQLKKQFGERPVNELTMGDVLMMIDENNWGSWFKTLKVLDFANIFSAMRSIDPATYKTRTPLATARHERPRGRSTESGTDRVNKLREALRVNGSLTREEVRSILDVKSLVTADKVIDLMIHNGMVAKEVRGRTHVFVPAKPEPTQPTTPTALPAEAPQPQPADPPQG